MSKKLLPTWVELSVRNHFLSHADIIDNINYVQGTNTEWPMIWGGIYKKMPDYDHLELRFDGPYINEVSRGVFDIEIEINVLITAFKNESVSTRISEAAGILLEAFDTIQLKRYDGSGDGSTVNCLRMKNRIPPTKGDRLEIRRFQQIDPKIQIEQAIVEAHYEAQLELE